MRIDQPAILNLEETLQLLRNLFPEGVRDREILAEIAPDGWRNSEYFLKRKNQESAEVDEENHCVETMGQCLADIFGTNNIVLDKSGAIVGGIFSWRNWGGCVAEFCDDDPTPGRKWGYISFFMGSIPFDNEAPSRQPIYRGIFRRLKQAGCDWRYGRMSWEGRRRFSIRSTGRVVPPVKIEVLRASLDHPCGEWIPPTICAYREVFGRWPIVDELG